MLTLEEILEDFASFVGADRKDAVGLSSAGREGETPLHWMATLGDAKAIRILIDAGAELSATDNNGNTPLHAAISSRQIDAARTLLALGAPSATRNSDGKSPLDIARADKYEPTIALFEKR